MASKEFQSAPGFSAGRNRNPPGSAPSMCVSIRSRLFGREKLRLGRHQSSWRTLFQSAPGFSAGRNKSAHRLVSAHVSFNPLPAFRPGETRSRREYLSRDNRFNPLPAFRPGETTAFWHPHNSIEVSIRSRLFGREKRVSPSMPSWSPASFNPLPAFRPGETIKIRPEITTYVVSIRSRLFGREKP